MGENLKISIFFGTPQVIYSSKLLLNLIITTMVKRER